MAQDLVINGETYVGVERVAATNIRDEKTFYSENPKALTVNVSAIAGGYRVSFTDLNGTKSFDLLNGAQGPIGVTGKEGAKGVPGVSPSVSVARIVGGHRVSITDAEGTKFFDVMDGIGSESGGGSGGTGAAGVTFYPYVSPDGVLSWTNNGELSNPDPVNIRGPRGYSGADGEDGADGADGGTVYVSSVADMGTYTRIGLKESKTGAVQYIDIPHGKDGAKGDPGESGTADAVQYVEQTLTEDQQKQARKNIFALGRDDVTINPIVAYGTLPGSTEKIVIASGFGVTISDEEGRSISGSALAIDPYQKARTYGFEGDEFSFYNKLAVSADGIELDATDNTLHLTSGGTRIPASGVALPTTSGESGEDGITPHIGSNGNWYIGTTDTGISATGPAGADGFSPTVEVMELGNNHFVTVTDKNGGQTFVVTNGVDGRTPTVGNNGNWWIGLDDTGVPATGTAGADGDTPVKGTDYWTDADKQEIVDDIVIVSDTQPTDNETLIWIKPGEEDVGDAVSVNPQNFTEAQKAQARENIGIDEAYKAELVAAVLDGIGCPVFGVVDENKTIILSGKLAEESYQVKYEMEDGSTVDIGELSFVPSVTYTNLFDPASAVLNQRVNSSYALAEKTGHIVTNFMNCEGKTPFTADTKIYIKGGTFTNDGNTKLMPFKSTSVTDYSGAYSSMNGSAMSVVDEGDGVISISGSALASNMVSGVKRFVLVLKVSDTTVTASDIEDIVITIDEPIG